ncbi:MAG: HAD family phosphatase [Lachnospiraceae bacterium]|nr:HAD family phosphatase [Lachnospiraceae bacterium]
MKDFDAVVFDMDGLIFDSERAGYECWSEVMKPFGFADILPLYREVIGCSRVRVEKVVRDWCGQDFPFDTFAEKVHEIYTARYGGGKMPIKPGAREILTFLKEQNRKTAIASSSEKRVVADLLSAADLLQFFDEIISGDMVERSKPEPDIFLKACRVLGTAPERTYAVEDSYHGIRAAHRAGLRPIMVPDMLPATDEMRSLAEDIETDLYGVTAYISGKENK